MNWQQILINIAITVAAALLTALGSWVLVKVGRQGDVSNLCTSNQRYGSVDAGSAKTRLATGGGSGASAVIDRSKRLHTSELRRRGRVGTKPNRSDALRLEKQAII